MCSRPRSAPAASISAGRGNVHVGDEYHSVMMGRVRPRDAAVRRVRSKRIRAGSGICSAGGLPGMGNVAGRGGRLLRGRRRAAAVVLERGIERAARDAGAKSGNAIGIPEVKFGTVLHADDIVAIPSMSYACGCSSMVEPQPSKLMVRVRFPSPAPMRGLSAILGRRIPSSGGASGAAGQNGM